MSDLAPYLAQVHTCYGNQLAGHVQRLRFFLAEFTPSETGLPQISEDLFIRLATECLVESTDWTRSFEMYKPNSRVYIYTDANASGSRASSVRVIKHDRLISNLCGKYLVTDLEHLSCEDAGEGEGDHSIAGDRIPPSDQTRVSEYTYSVQSSAFPSKLTLNLSGDISLFVGCELSSCFSRTLFEEVSSHGLDMATHMVFTTSPEDNETMVSTPVQSRSIYQALNEHAQVVPVSSWNMYAQRGENVDDVIFSLGRHQLPESIWVGAILPGSSDIGPVLSYLTGKQSDEEKDEGDVKTENFNIMTEADLSLVLQSRFTGSQGRPDATYHAFIVVNGASRDHCENTVWSYAQSILEA